MRTKKTSKIIAASLVLALTFSISFMNTTQAGTISYSKNSRGETYGNLIQAKQLGYEPQLIAAVGTKGEEGFLRAEDESAVPKSPEEALELQKSTANGRYIPLYANDGITVIGQFYISPSVTEEHITPYASGNWEISPTGYINGAAGYNYENWNRITDYLDAVEGATVIRCTNGNSPSGWMGAKARVIKVSTGAVVAENDWKYNTSSANSFVNTVTHFTVANSYYCEGMTREWSGSSFWTHGTFKTPNINAWG